MDTVENAMLKNTEGKEKEIGTRVCRAPRGERPLEGRS
jgi:hypothetical protein